MQIDDDEEEGNKRLHPSSSEREYDNDDNQPDEPTSIRQGQQLQQQQSQQFQQTRHQYESLSTLLFLRSGTPCPEVGDNDDDDESYRNEFQPHRAFSMEDDRNEARATGMFSSLSSLRFFECGGGSSKRDVSNNCKCVGYVKKMVKRTYRSIRRNYDSPCVISLGLSGLLVCGTILGCIFPSSSSTSSTSPSPSSWDVTSNILGYTYFLSWTLSFYPQILTNHFHPSRAKRGVSLDFVVWNMVGFACYAAFVTSFRYSDAVRREYGERFGEAAAASAADGESDGGSSASGGNQDWDGDVEPNATVPSFHRGLPTFVLLNGAFDAFYERIIDNYLQINGNESDINGDGANTAYHDATANSTNGTAFHADGDDDDAIDNSFDNNNDMNGDKMGPLPVPEVRSNDVAFAWHALILTIVIFVQITWCAERTCNDDDESNDNDDNDDDANKKERNEMTEQFLNSDWLEVEEGEDMRVEDFGRAPSLSSRSSGFGDVGVNDVENAAKNRGFRANSLHWSGRAFVGDDGVDHPISVGGNGEGFLTTPGEVATLASPRDQRLSRSQIDVQRRVIGKSTNRHWSQRISPVTKIFVSVLLFTCIIGAIFVTTDWDTSIWGRGDWQWIDYLYFLSFVKVGITIVKYIPQVSSNAFTNDIFVMKILIDLFDRFIIRFGNVLGWTNAGVTKL